MDHDIRTRLRDAAAAPTHTPDFDTLADRARRRHLATRAATATIATVGVIVAGILVWPSAPASSPYIGDDPSTPTSPAGGALPARWQRVEVGPASFAVPGDWTVTTLTETATFCPNTVATPTVFVATAGVNPDGVCKLPDFRSETLLAMPLGFVPSAGLEVDEGDSWQTVQVNGFDGHRLRRDDRELTIAYSFPTLDLWLEFAGAEPTTTTTAEAIVATLARAEPMRPPGPTGPALGPAVGTLTLTYPRPVANHPDPVVRAGAAGTEVDCNGPVHLGGWALDAGGPAAGTARPRAALNAFLGQGLFGLPTNGYLQAVTEPGRVLFTYVVNGVPKVAVIVADGTVVAEPVNAPDGWGFEVFATCDPAEYAPSAETFQTVWTDRDGNRVPTTTITSFPGPSHCDWESVTFLHLNDHQLQFVRDPEQRLAGQTVQPYDGDTQLPPDASDTGYRNDKAQLWLSTDRSIAYLVTDGTIEAWPATTAPVGCR